MSIKAGKYNRKIEIFEEITTADDYGDSSTTTLKFKGYAWAMVKPTTGRDTLEKMQYGRTDHATMIYILEIRFDKNISITDKILFDGYYMDILSIAGRGRLLREAVEAVCEIKEVSKLVMT